MMSRFLGWLDRTTEAVVTCLYGPPEILDDRPGIAVKLVVLALLVGVVALGVVASWLP